MRAEHRVITRREFIIGTSALAGASALTLAVAGCGGSSSSVGPAPSPNRWIGISTAGLQAGEPRWVEFDTTATTGRPSPSAMPTGGSPTTVAESTPEASLPATRGGAWLVKDGSGSIVAFAPFCPHQRCLYDWDAAETRFHCRCHAGFFSIEGAVLGGPPPRPLDRYETRPAGPGAIEIGWVDGT
jgi:Rieske Fe-S protein